MVHALEEIHHLLKPTGVLIDIHPISVASPVEIHQDGKIDTVGLLSVRQWCYEFEQADIALAEVARRGLFAVERHVEFDSLTHYASAAEMGTSLQASIESFARDPQAAVEPLPHVQALSARAAEMMQGAASNAELVIRERTHISRLKPA